MLDVFHRHPLGRLLLPLLGGIVFAYTQFAAIPCVGVLFLLLLIFTLFVFLLRTSYSYRWIFGLSLTALIFISGYYLTNIRLSNIHWKVPETMQKYQAQLLEDPIPKSNSWMCHLYLSEIDKQVVVYLQADSSMNLQAGNWIELTALFQHPKNFTSDFDYHKYLTIQGISATAYVDEAHWYKINSPKHILPEFKVLALHCRQQLMDRLRKIISKEQHYAVATAILLGYKDNMDSTVKRKFAATGASHILAVSGLHVSMICAVLYSVLSFLGNRKMANRIRYLLILPSMWMFAFVTGLSPSVVRATLMLSLVSLGTLFERKSLSLNTLSASAFFMLLYNPLYLFDVGFQLSYTAVASIVIINPLLSNIYRSNNKLLQYGWSLITVSTAAQLGTMPLTLYYFHQFPSLFLLTNLFVIPLSAVLLTTLIGVLFLDVLSLLPPFLYWPVNALLECFLSGIEKIERIPYSLISGISISLMTVWIMYIILLLFIMASAYRRVLYVYIAVALVVFQVIYYL